MEGGVVAFLASPLCDAKYSYMKNKVVSNKLLCEKRGKHYRKKEHEQSAGLHTEHEEA